MSKCHFVLIFAYLILFISSQSKIVEVEEGTKNVSLKVKKGEIFQIKLKGNPTTGYSWFLVNYEIVNKNEIIKPTNLNEHLSAQFVPCNRHDEILGAGGDFVFEFEVLKSSNVIENLNFSYRRPWVKNNNKEPDVIVSITIED